jgi:hypothetical protein
MNTPPSPAIQDKAASAQATAQRRRAFPPTILDALIFISAVAVALALARTFTLAGKGGRWQSFLAYSWFITGILSGPAIVAAQYLRGRRGRLGFGEALWVVPASLWNFATCVGWCVPGPLTGLLTLMVVGTQVLCGLAAFYYLPFATLFRPPWLDWLGAAMCLTMLIAFVLLIHYSVDDAYFEWGMLHNG